MVDADAPAAPGSTGEPEVLGWAALLLVVGARAYRAILLSLVVVATVPLLWSWSSHVVRTGSMEPSVAVGDVVVARPFASTEEVPVGRVLVFGDPADPSAPADPADRRLLVHRVVSDRGDGTWTTRGDANQANDSTPVAHQDIRARALLLVPYVGRPFVWLTDGDLLRLTGWLLVTMLAFVVAARHDRVDRDARGGRGGPLRPVGVRLTKRVRRHRANRLRAALRVLALPALALAAVAGSASTWGATADAAFTASTGSGGSWTVSTTLALRVSLDPPGDVLRGTAPLTATLSGSSGPGTTVRIDYAVAGTSTWRTVCTRSAAPYTCDWATTAVTNQDYDLRAVAVSGTTTVTSEVVPDVLVDNAAPTVVVQDPGSPLRGTVTLRASAADAHSGIDRVVLQYAVTGTATWRDVCTSEEEPATCAFDTTAVADGSYSLRAVATDVAGNTATSSTVTNRTVDNRVASVSVTDPGAFLSGTVQLAASAYSPSGVVSVRIQRAPSGSTTWTDVCTDTTSPYGCPWNTATVANGLYDLRAVLLDGAGRTTTSTTVTQRRVDNSPLRAVDVQTVQGGAVPGRVDQGDRIVLTYSTQVALTSIVPGWSGAGQAVTVRVRDGGLVGTGSTGDTLDVLRTGGSVNLGSVNLKQSFVRSLRTIQLAATMTASTVTVNGIPATQVTLTLGAQTSGSAPTTVSASGAMVWTPSTAATDLVGRPASAIPATETGTLDRDF